MKRHWFLKFVNSLGFALFLFDCQSEYKKLEKKEFAFGKEVNELFFGLELGMDRKSFFETCLELNQQGKHSNGPTELSIENKSEMPSGNPARMRFFPKFEQDKIYLMPIEFTYEGWEPWNEELSAEKLREDVVKLFEEWYGPGFIEVSNEDKSQIGFVKIDGNRSIRIFKKHISAVRVDISDLPVEKKLKENTNS